MLSHFTGREAEIVGSMCWTRALDRPPWSPSPRTPRASSVEDTLASLESRDLKGFHELSELRGSRELDKCSLAWFQGGRLVQSRPQALGCPEEQPTVPV